MEKSRIRDYRDLLVWQKAMDLVVAVERVCEQLPPKASRLALDVVRLLAGLVRALRGKEKATLP